MSASKTPDGPPVTVEARCVRLLAKAADPASIAPVVERRPLSRAANELLIEVKAAAVNPSDVESGHRPDGVCCFPRTPGRDYAGIVIDGPAGWIGREVFGSSGDLGIRRDGTHATHLAVEADAVVEKPKGLSWEEAAGIGVPFVTAMEGLSPRRTAEERRDRRSDGRQRQGRPGRGADRKLERRTGGRRGAQTRSLRGVHQFEGRGHRCLRHRCGEPGARTHRRQGRRHRVQYRRRSLFSGGAPIAGAARASDPDRHHRTSGALQHPGILSRPAHLCRHRYAGAVVDCDRRGAAGARGRASPADTSSRFRSSRARSIRWKTPRRR